MQEATHARKIRELFDEAMKATLSSEDMFQKFERLRLLEGLQNYVSETMPLLDMLMTHNSLMVTFQVNPSEVDKSRNEYLCDRILEMIKANGYLLPIDPVAIEKAGIPKGFTYAALSYLCKQGLVVQNDDEKYRPTPQIWKEEVEAVKERIMKVDSELDDLISEKSRDFEKIGKRYIGTLGRASVVADSLKALREKQTAEAISQRILKEGSHISKHHTGPWIQNMVKEYRKFFREALSRLPQEIAVDWADERR